MNEMRALSFSPWSEDLWTSSACHSWQKLREGDKHSGFTSVNQLFYFGHKALQWVAQLVAAAEAHRNEEWTAAETLERSAQLQPDYINPRLRGAPASPPTHPHTGVSRRCSAGVAGLSHTSTLNETLVDNPLIPPPAAWEVHTPAWWSALKVSFRNRDNTTQIKPTVTSQQNQPSGGSTSWKGSQAKGSGTKPRDGDKPSRPRNQRAVKGFSKRRNVGPEYSP